METKQNGNAIGFLRNITGFSISTWIGGLISIISVPFTTRLFSPEQVGAINMFTYFSSLFLMLFSLGLDQAYVRFYNEPPNGRSSKYILTLGLLISLLVTMLFSIIILAFFPAMLSRAISGEDKAYLRGYNPVLPWLLFINVIMGIFLRFLNLNNRMRQNIFAYTIQSILTILSTKLLYLVAAFWKPIYINAITLMVLGTTGIAIIYLFIQKRELVLDTPIVDIDTTKTLLAFGLPLIPAAVLVWLNSSISSLLLKNFQGGLYSVGIYTQALSVASIISLIQVGFSTYWVAYVYSSYKTEQDKIKRIHSYITFAMVLFGLLIIMFQDVIFLLIGKNYISAKLFFPFLLVYPICSTISETTGLGIGISKRTNLSIIPAVANVGTNTIICLLLLPLLDITGPAIASAVAGVVTLFVRTIIGEKYYKCINSYFRTSIAILIIILAAATNYVLFSEPILKMFILSCLLLILIVLYYKDAKYLVNIIHSIVKKLPAKKRS